MLHESLLGQSIVPTPKVPCVYTGPPLKFEDPALLPTILFDNGNPVYIHKSSRKHVERRTLKRPPFGTESPEFVRNRQLHFVSLHRNAEVSEAFIATWLYLFVASLAACIVSLLLRGPIPQGEKGFSQELIPMIQDECLKVPPEALLVNDYKRFFERFKKSSSYGFQKTQIGQEDLFTAGLKRKARMRPLAFNRDPVMCPPEMFQLPVPGSAAARAMMAGGGGMNPYAMPPAPFSIKSWLFSTITSPFRSSEPPPKQDTGSSFLEIGLEILNHMIPPRRRTWFG